MAVKVQAAQFAIDSAVDLKAHEAESGDLIIEGIAADYGMDDQDEAFEPGAVASAAKEFMASGNTPLLFHHHFDKQLGKVLELEPRPEGLYMKARIDKPAAGSWAEDVYNKVRKDSMKGLSVAGRFFRRLTPEGTRIHRAGFREISVTPLQVNQRTLIGAVAQKAFSDDNVEVMEDPAADAPPDPIDGQITQVSLGGAESTEDEISPEQLEMLDQWTSSLKAIYDELDAKAATTKHGSWDGSAGRFTDQQYARSCVLHRGGKGYSSVKAAYSLPVREPDGTLNCTAVSAALGRIDQVKGATQAEIDAARRKLQALEKRCNASSESEQPDQQMSGN